MQTRAKTYRTVVLSILGFIILVTPLVLWASWSQAMFVGVLVVGGASALSYCILARRWDEGYPQSRLVARAEAESEPGPFVDGMPPEAPSRIGTLLRDPLVWIGVTVMALIWWLIRA
jgi:hypothetical protein